MGIVIDWSKEFSTSTRNEQTGSTAVDVAGAVESYFEAHPVSIFELVHLTQAQYDALTPEEQASGDYIIDDAD